MRKKNTPKEKKEMHLWYSKRKAETGKIFYVPDKDGKEVTACTDITEEFSPPTESSEYVISELLPSVGQ